MSGPGPHEISPLGWDCAVRLSPGEGSRARANRARRLRLRSVSRRGIGVKRHSGRPRVEAIRTSGVVGNTQWLGLGWRVRVAFSFFEMSQDFPNHLLLGDEGDDAIGASAVALERIGLMNAPDDLDELCPSFPERGALFGGQFRLRLGFGVLLAGERLQGEVFPFSIACRERLGGRLRHYYCAAA